MFLFDPGNKTMTKNFNIKDAAAYLGVAPVTIRRLLARGEGPRFFKVGVQLRFTEEALLDYQRRLEREQEELQLQRRAMALVGTLRW